MKFNKSIPLSKVKCIEVHPNQQLIYLGMYNGTVLVYDSVTLSLLTAISLGNVVRSVAVTEKYIITGDDSGTVSIFDMNYFKITSKKIHGDFIRKVAVKENLIFSCSDDCTILISDLNLGKVGILEGHKHFVMDFCFNNNLLYSVSLDCSLGIFNLQSKKGNFITLHDNGINCVTFFNQLIVTGSDDPSIKLISNSVVVSKLPFTSNVVKVINHEENLLVCCENGEFRILSKELETLHQENLRTKLWDVKAKNNKMFLAIDEGLKVYDFIKLQFGFVTNEKAFFVEGDSLFYTRFTDSAFLVKDTKLEYEPEKVIFSENGKTMCIFKENTFNLINTLGFRTKLSGECKEMSIGKELFVTLDDKGITLYENNKMIDTLKIFPKKVKIIDNFLVCQFDKKIQVLTKEGNLVKQMKTNEKIIDFFFLDEIFYFTNEFLFLNNTKIYKKILNIFIYKKIIFFISNNMLYYLINHKNKVHFIFICNVNGFPLGINERGLVIYEDTFKIIDIKIDKIIECIDVLNKRKESTDNILLTQFLISIGEYEEALCYSLDPLVKFDILLRLNRLEECIPLCDNKMMYQKLAKKFLELKEYDRVSELFFKGEDYDSAFLFDFECKEKYPKLESDLEIVRMYRNGSMKEFFKGSEFENIIEKNY